MAKSAVLPSWRFLSMPFNLGFQALSSRDGLVEMVFNFIWNHLNRPIILCEYSRGLRFENWVLTFITKLNAVNEYRYHSCTIQCCICHRKIRPQAIAQHLHELKDILEVIHSWLNKLCMNLGVLLFKSPNMSLPTFLTWYSHGHSVTVTVTK